MFLNDLITIFNQEGDVVGYAMATYIRRGGGYIEFQEGFGEVDVVAADCHSAYQAA